MAELLQWKHFGRPIENTTLEVRYISVLLELEEVYGVDGLPTSLKIMVPDSAGHFVPDIKLQ